jgi:hypothetical protein
MLHIVVFSAVSLLGIMSGFAQHRIADNNDIFWTPVTVQNRLPGKWFLHTEFQWRRTDRVQSPQQNLLRLGVTWQAKPQHRFQVGYAWILTYPYGDFPLAENGTFAERRTYQQWHFVTESGWRGAVFSSRMRTEQRWLEVLDTNSRFIRWNYLNRIRLMQRMQWPLNSIHKNMYVALSDEIFIGFGKNVGLNIFDQNRLFGLLGMNLNKSVQLEMGVLNQILQQGKAVDGKPVFQYNTGPVLGCNIKL